VLQPDGSFAFMPAWMIEPAASRFEIGDAPHFPLDILRSMRAEVDALLGFLRSESKPEQVHDDARIRESPAKPVRRGGTSHRPATRLKGRTRRPRGGPASRDRSIPGKRGKR
jgi:hypothetical protein